jgi:alpha-tubulin suppressor-like RCC1 family protein
LYGWGYNGSGYIGDGTTTARANPTATSGGITTWTSVSTGYITGAIKLDNTLWMWGINSNGQLGNGARTAVYTPIQIGADATWSVVSTGRERAGAIKTDGTLWMWGENSNGQLGTNNTTSYSSPVQTVAGGSNWSSLAVGRVCVAAIKTDGTLWMWGSGVLGVLGNNTTDAKSSPVQTVAAGTNWSQVSVDRINGANGLCVAAIKTDGTLWTWGNNEFGQLGTNNITKYSSPVQTVAGGSNWRQVDCSAGHSMYATKTDGTAWTWGLNDNGQLGVNDTTNRSSPTQVVGGATNWSSISGSYAGGVAIKTNGTLWTWGNNGTFFESALGNGDSSKQSSPVQVGALTTWIAASGGGYGGMAIR